MIGIAFVSIFEKFNWHNVGMLHADSGKYGSSFHIANIENVFIEGLVYEGHPIKNETFFIV